MDATELDSAEAIRTRTASLVEYLLAVRGLLDSPARTVPAGDTWWEPDLPVQEAVELGPAGPGEPWLSVGRPAAPADPPIPDGLVAHLSWDLSTVDEPRLAGAAVPADPAFQQRQRELMAWLDQVWRPWSRLATAATAARTLHDRLYDLQHRLDNEAARLELVWGHVILVAEVAGQRVRYPLLASPVELEYDPETTTVTVSPLGPPRLQTGALSGLDDRRLGDLLDLAGPGGQVAIDPWDATERREFAARALRRLGLDATVVAPGGRTPAGPYVLDTGVLFVRPRQRMVRRFLAEMRTALAATGTGTGALASVLAHEPSRLALPDDDPAAWVASGQRLLMPLPTNDAQESIARRLAEHRSVAVQGPPGTGKTHTIRNLICHLVAHGKRVLVLAQKEDPLRVLRDGLPEALRPLCLAVLGRSADQLVQLQVAARELSDRAATLDIEAESGWADRMVADIDAATAELAAAQQALQTAAQRESARYGDAEAGTSASEVGAWLRREAPLLGFIPDPVPPGTPAPLDRAEFATLVDIARRVPAADRAASLGLSLIHI